MSIFSSIASTLGLSAPTPTQAPKYPLNDIVANQALNLNGIYTTYSDNWYTAKPYGFQFNPRTGGQFLMFLPISPSNLSITTHFATNIIPTLYGTIEEHSDVRYYDIVIEGNTGMAPHTTIPYDGENPLMAYTQGSPGRASYDITSNVKLGGFFQSTVQQVTNILNLANTAVSAVSGLGSNSTAPEINTGLYTDQTGYQAFHSLYKFLLRYKKDAAGVYSNIPYKAHPLIFFNYKDGNQYNVVVRSFDLKRSADSPMMYHYRIVMRGYNITNSGNSVLNGIENLKNRLTDLGLAGVKSSTLLSQIKNVSNIGKAVAGSAVNGVNTFGS